jgi:hypothetical protein
MNNERDIPNGQEMESEYDRFIRLWRQETGFTPPWYIEYTLWYIYCLLYWDALSKPAPSSQLVSRIVSNLVIGGIFGSIVFPVLEVLTLETMVKIGEDPISPVSVHAMWTVWLSTAYFFSLYKWYQLALRHDSVQLVACQMAEWYVCDTVNDSIFLMHHAVVIYTRWEKLREQHGAAFGGGR